MTKMRLASIAMVILALLMAVTPVLAADPVPGKGNTDVVVQNTNQSQPTDVKAVYYDTDGNIDFEKPQSINAKGSHIFKAFDATLGDNWTGSMILQSSEEVAAVAEILWTEGSSTDGTTAAAYTGYASGATTMYLPFAVYSKDSQFTRVTVQNTEDFAANISIDYVNREGGKDFTTTDSIPRFGSKTYDLSKPGGAVPNFSTTSFWQARCNEGQCFWSGALKITATNNAKLTVVATNHWRWYAAAFNAFTAGNATNFVPSVERRCTDCTFNGGVWQGYSVITVQCLETSQNCNVVMDFVKEDGTSSGTLPEKTIVAGGALAASTRNGNDWEYSWFNTNLPNPWAGSAVVRSTNGTKLGVVSYSIRPERIYAAGANGASTSVAGTETFLPSAQQIGPCPDTNFQFQAFSIIRIQNPGTAKANDVDVYYYNRDGSLAFQRLNQQIDPGKSISQHTRVDCSSITVNPGNNRNWLGAVYVKSDQPVVAVLENHYWGNRTFMTAYNSYSVNR